MFFQYPSDYCIFTIDPTSFDYMIFIFWLYSACFGSIFTYCCFVAFKPIPPKSWPRVDSFLLNIYRGAKLWGAWGGTGGPLNDVVDEDWICGAENKLLCGTTE